MLNSEYEQQYKQEVIDFFNSRTSYDNDYTIRRAVPLLELVSLENKQKVLDLATGTGIIAIAAAQIVGEGKVIGVDFSSGMIAQAQKKIDELNLQNIELIEADVEYIDFDDESNVTSLHTIFTPNSFAAQVSVESNLTYKIIQPINQICLNIKI